MIKKLLNIAGLLLLFWGCEEPPKPISINSKKLLENIKILASDSMEGRAFSTKGSIKAQKFIEKKFSEIGLEKYKNGSYIEAFDYTFKGKKRQDAFPIENPGINFSNVKDTIVSGSNIIGKLKGSSNKTIIITAHYDHLGIRDKLIFNGADDNASGVAALFTIAEYFKNNPLKHTLIFAAVDGEEIGSVGAEVLLKNYANKENIALNVNMDMIAHSDYYPELYISGTYHYPNFKKTLNKVKSDYVTILFGHDDPEKIEQSDWTLSSDHRVFFKEKIPFIYFGVEDHKDYHRPTDKFATINQKFYVESVKVIIRSIEALDGYLMEKK
ncbi:M20/M25/M40 family metallo-hydrolase [Polaribacter sp.]|uniref:M20/M25/M40 family metallo-hydrolase n=1 Tax=Polaribacter sp. TaxID=1920175 RepID=UPI004048369C